MTVGERIKAARKKAGMTQKELADKLGIPYQGISQYERGIRNPKIDTLVKIADSLGVSAPSLLGKSSERAASESLSLGVKLSQALAEYEAAKRRGAPKEELVQLMEKCNTLGREANQRAQESILLREFQLLNSTGKEAALGYVKALAEMPEYQDRMSEIGHILPEETPHPPEETPTPDTEEKDSGKK